LRIAAKFVGGLLLLIAVGVGVLFWAVTREPEFYRVATAVDPIAQQQASHEMLQQAAALKNESRREGRWQAVFTAEQINGWLAVDLVENHPDALPETLRDPRVAIEPGRMMLACRFQQGRAGSVLALAVEPYLPEPNVLALRISKARAGLMPMPLSEVLDQVSQAAVQAGLPVQWRQDGGEPVAWIPLPSLSENGEKRVQIDTLELRRGEIYLAGSTRQRKEP
jgi:uncharacterized protein YpmS